MNNFLNGSSPVDFTPTRDELPPMNIEAEEAILGGLLLDPNAITRMADRLDYLAFMISTHGEIYQACLSLHAQNKPTDVLAVKSWLEDRGQLERVGGMTKLVSLVDRTVSAVNIDALADLVMNKYKRRQLIKAGNRIVQLGYAADMELPEAMEQAESELFAVTGDIYGATEPTSLADIMVDTYARIEERHTDGGDRRKGVATGFYDLDILLNGGLKPGKLITIAARPGCGKSSFVGNIAINMAREGHPAVIFSMEMDKEEWADRFVSQDSGIESHLLQTGKLTHARQWEAVSESVSRLADFPLYIDDSPYLTVTAVRAKVKRLLARTGPLAMVGIDYLGLMEDIGSNSGNLAFSIGKVTRALKQLARECQVPIALLCQLNRGVESRNNKRPTSADLRDSGRIEEDSDIIITLYREEIYEPETMDKGVAEVGVVKHRGGASGTIKLLFDAPYTQFKNLVNERQF